VILVIGIAAYHNFFRQTNANLIEIVPANRAVFLFQLHDNEYFVKNTTSLRPYLNTLFMMESITGFEAIIEHINIPDLQVLAAGLQMDNGIKLLYGAKIDKLQFRQLLQALQIDSRNYEKWQDNRIYSYASHLRKFNFTHFHNALIISEDIEAVKIAITQFKNPINLLSDNQFQTLYQLVNKNKRQNWLLLQHERFSPVLAAQSDSNWKSVISQLAEVSQWSAFQLHINNNEIYLSGYCPAQSVIFQQYKNQQTSTNDFSDCLPMDCYSYSAYFITQPSDFINSTIAQNIREELPPKSLYFFTLNHHDTIIYYTLLQTDTTYHLTTQLAEDSLPDLTYHKNYTIYQTHFTALSKDTTQSLAYMTPYKNCYIFADSPKALQYYLDKITSDKTLLNNNFYKYVHSHLPSERCFEFFGQNIAHTQLFTLSFDPPSHNFIPITIYARF